MVFLLMCVTLFTLVRISVFSTVNAVEYILWDLPIRGRLMGSSSVDSAPSQPPSVQRNTCMSDLAAKCANIILPVFLATCSKVLR